MSRLRVLSRANSRIGRWSSLPTEITPAPPPETPSYLEDAYYNDPVAFEGAMGYGANATGGRSNGTEDTSLLFVDNLNDSGTGSLRQALEVATGKRVIVPRVSGYISLADDIRPKDNYTFLGQLSPGGLGVRPVTTGGYATNGLIYHYPTTNFILRYLTIRSETVDPGGTFDTNDALRLAGGANGIVDHCSISYATDGVADVSGTTAATIQDCIIAYPLTGDPEGNHEFCSLTAYGCQVTLARNIYTKARGRVPEIHSGSTVQFVGNTIYNCRQKSLSHVQPGKALNVVDIVRNTYRQGEPSWDPMSGSESPLAVRNQDAGTTRRDVIYMEGNDSPLVTDPTVWSQQENMVYVYSAGDSVTDPSRDPLEWISNTPNGMPTLPSETAAAYYAHVLANAGNVLFRDSVDTAVVNEIVNNTGTSGAYATATAAGGYPAFTSSAYPTATYDGAIEDAWHVAQGGYRNWWAITSSGRMVIEDYADDIAQGRWPV